MEEPELAWAEGEVLEINDKKAKVRSAKGNEVNGCRLQIGSPIVERDVREY